MRKLNLKKVIVASILAILTLIELFALGLSKAKKVSNINLSVQDSDGILNEYIIITDTNDGGESGYYIELPEFINSKRVANYIIKQKEIITDSSKTKDEETETTEEKKLEDINKQPGDKLFLTQDELDNNKVTLAVKYDKTTVDDKTLYNTKLEKIIDEEKTEVDQLNNIEVSGYMPNATSLKIEELTEEQDKLLQEQNVEDYMIAKEINIQLSNNNEIYENDSDKEYTVSISEIDSKKQYKVISIIDNDESEENKTKIAEIEAKQDDGILSFNLKRLQPFAILESKTQEQIIAEAKEGSDDEETPKEDEEQPRVRLAAPKRSASSGNEDVWDGTIATEFALGEGTENFPYLISKGSELAYLASQVNAGTTYEGIYFQLANDINLNEREWTPIGTISNSFRGIFNGAGFAISNAKITLSSYPTTLTTYGIFGSIGGGNTRSIIKNAEFNGVNITITATGRTSTNNTIKGFHLGTVTGTMYKNSSIINVIAKDSLITNSQRVEIGSAAFRIATGGICGIVLNTSSSETDPGAGARYQIENCYSGVDIDLIIRDTQDNRTYFGQFASGGIVGIIRSQPVWPTNCTYKGTIPTRGFSGPIFGQVRNNTSYTSTSNYNTLWQRK